MDIARQIMGTPKGSTTDKPVAPTPGPNRAQRRAAEQARAARIRRGQRAFNRQQKEQGRG